MIRKIISCGDAGVADAALRSAEKLGLSCGGWKAPGGGTDPDPPAVLDPRLETAVDAEDAFRRNVMEADATVLITRGPPGGRTEGIRRICEQAGRPVLHLDLKEAGAFQAAQTLSRWVGGLKVEVLHVAGSRIDRDPGLVKITRNLLEAFFYLSLMEKKAAAAPPDSALPPVPPPPKTVAEATERLKGRLPLRDKTTIANLSESELSTLDSSLGEYIRNAFQLWSGNYALLDSCRFTAKQKSLENEDAAAVIIRELWKDLKKSHTLRVIK